jgi:predicted Zn-ribbon and HTH transcriptional regulator
MKLTEEEIKEHYPDVNLKPGEFMMACRWCGYRCEKNYVGFSTCPVCKSNLMILKNEK